MAPSYSMLNFGCCPSCLPCSFAYRCNDPCCILTIKEKNIIPLNLCPIRTHGPQEGTTDRTEIATVQVSLRRPASESPSQVRIITARRAVHPRSSPAAPSSTFQGLHHQRRTRPHRVIFLLPPTQGFKNQVSANPLKTKIKKLSNNRIRAIAH